MRLSSTAAALKITVAAGLLGWMSHGGKLELQQAVTAVPVAPGGIGVGQAAFYALFQLLLPGKGTLGANAFTVYQFVLMLIYLSGFYFYLTYRSRPEPSPAAEPEMAIIGGKQL